MKFSRSVIAVGVAAVLLHGELSQWVQHIEAGSPLEAIFFRTVTLPGGPVASRRPPRETVPELSKAIAASPVQTDLLALRAHESELQLDFAAAEKDWRAFAQGSTDKLRGALELADYFARRNQAKEEFAALLEAARIPAGRRDGLEQEERHVSWRAFVRAKDVIARAALGAAAEESLHKAWMARYPARGDVAAAYVDVLIAAKRFPEAEAVAKGRDEAFGVRTRAAVEEARGSAERAKSIYDRAFQPLWPPGLVAEYFQLLGRTRSLRAFLTEARAAATANPEAVDPAARIFYYWQQAGNLPQAHRALLELRLRKKSWTPAELVTVAKLFEATANYAEAARHFHEAIADEQGLTGLIRVLLAAPEQPVRIGSGDLSYYRDIATVDRYPGFLNGLLSLLFNSSDPEGEFRQQEYSAIPYFHRAKAAELLAELDRKFPKSSERAVLHASLIEAYGDYGENATVLKKGQEYLAAFPKVPQRAAVALAMADAYARMNRLKEEFAVYDALLKELGAAASGVPLGTASPGIPQGQPEEGEQPMYRAPRAPMPARSPEYAKVLDRYLARLASMKRVKEAIALYRGEIDRNPDDPGLYDRLAHFLDENRRGAEIEEVYTRATKQFADRSWHHKLARWYLRQKQGAAFDKLSREVAGVFTGSELESYFQQVVGTAGIDSALFRQVNLYAHQRFPHDLVFVRNLVEVYGRRETFDAAAAERLLRQNWYYDRELRSRFFELLSRTGRLETELQALGKMPVASLADRAAHQFIAEAQLWRCHFEAGAPSLQMVANTFVGDEAVNDRAASLYRSLGQTEAAVRFASRLVRAQPGSVEALARVGDIYADKERFDVARQQWNAMPAVMPGRPDGYLEAATVFWDYYHYDDALRVIGQGRKQLGQASLFAYEAGAIHEGRRDYKTAVREYLAGAMAEPEGAARRRLLRLASRPAHRDALESATAAGASGSDVRALDLRIAVLEEQNRRDELAALLGKAAAATPSFDALARIEEAASRNDLADVRLLVLDRQAALTPDPVEKVQLRIASARLMEQRGDIAGAQARMAEVYRENPAVLGVVRTTVDFYWRNKQGAVAVDTLEQAAGRSNASFRRAFLLEGARKATDLQQYARARKMLDPLLAEEPAAADLVAAASDTYARAGDIAGMRAFLAERLKLTSGETQAQLRRTLIPVLVRMKDTTAALDQYIEVLNRYPEDSGLLQEIADFARRNSLGDRVMGYYTKASADSPRDARWPAVLARLEMRLDRLDDAVAQYTRALAIRPDRADLLEERAGAEERLLRLDEASKSCSRLYELAHRNPRWLVKAAESRARLGDKDGALRFLRTAFLDNVKPRAQEFFEMARTLERWNWLAESKQFADQGLQALPAGDLRAADHLMLYLRVSTRLRQYETAWREVQGRATQGLSPEQLLSAAAQEVRSYYTPEEKAAFAKFLEGAVAAEARAGIAQSAGLMDVAAAALHEQLAASPALAADGMWRRLGDLQQRRMQYGEFAGQMESYWRGVPAQHPSRWQLLETAAQSQRIAGNPKDEMRLLELMARTGTMSGTAAARYVDLMRRSAPERLVELAAQGNPLVRAAAVEAVFEGSDAELALRVIAARGRKLPPVWTSAYTALTGHYFSRKAPEIAAAFDEVMGPRTVAGQLAAKPDATRQLNGDQWYPYAARYGEYLASEDFVAAEVESRPFAPGVYVALGDWYRDRGAYAPALVEYGHAVQLDRRNAVAMSRTASVLATQGKMAEAQVQWRLALAEWNRMQEGRVPEHFWPGVASTFESIGKFKAFAALRNDMDAILRTYVRRNGNMRAEPLLEAAFRAAPDAGAGAAWLADIARAANRPAQLLGSLIDDQWLPAPARDVLFQHLLQAAEAEVSRLAGQQRQEAQYALRNWRLHQVRSLLATGRGPQAWALLKALDAETRSQMRYDLTGLELRAAVSAGTLAEVLAGYAAAPEDAPQDEQLLREVEAMRSAGQERGADQVLEYVYTRQSTAGGGGAPALLGLAELRLKAADVAAASALMRRVNHSMGEPFEYLGASAALLERYKQLPEALEMWKARARAVPWDTAAATAVARLTKDAAAMRRLATDPANPYPARVEAALGLGGASGLGSAELDLLAAGRTIAISEAEAPYFFQARVRGAQPGDAPARVRLLRGALAIDPDASDVRAALFRAALQADYPSVSIAVWHPLMNSSERFQAEQFLTASGLQSRDRGQVAQGLAESHRKLGQIPQAVILLKVARELGTDSGPMLEALERQQRVAEDNRRRRPAVTDSVVQPGRVAPRVAAEGGVQ